MRKNLKKKKDDLQYKWSRINITRIFLLLAAERESGHLTTHSYYVKYDRWKRNLILSGCGLGLSVCEVKPFSSRWWLPHVSSSLTFLPVSFVHLLGRQWFVLSSVTLYECLIFKCIDPCSCPVLGNNHPILLFDLKFCCCWILSHRSLQFLSSHQTCGYFPFKYLFPFVGPF